MHNIILLTIFLLTSALVAQTPSKFALVIHGGAGSVDKKRLGEAEKDYRKKLEQALQEGYKILKNGGTSLDAVQKTITILEDSPLFNAGKGAVFTSAGKNELDASIMDGKTLNAGAVASVTTIKNPIMAARQVMEASPHVLLVGKGAELFAKKKNIQIVDPKYFFVQQRWDALQSRKKREKHGTVGAVALDQNGNLAAGTSTGGLTYKSFGRVGDSPIIGAGTYANNKTCAVSCTGHGEYFIRLAIAHNISAIIEYKKTSLNQAVEMTIDKLTKLGGSGGVIALNAQGDIKMQFNTRAMFRGFVKSDGKVNVAIYKAKE